MPPWPAGIDQIYNGFIVHVSAGRNIPEDTVRDIAKGRVWTGDQALGLRLVDRLGGFYDAVDEAKSLAKLTGDVRPGQLSLKPFDVWRRWRKRAHGHYRVEDPLLPRLGDERSQGRSGDGQCPPTNVCANRAPRSWRRRPTSPQPGRKPRRSRKALRIQSIKSGGRFPFRRFSLGACGWLSADRRAPPSG